MVSLKAFMHTAEEILKLQNVRFATFIFSTSMSPQMTIVMLWRRRILVIIQRIH